MLCGITCHLCRTHIHLATPNKRAPLKRYFRILNVRSDSDRTCLPPIKLYDSNKISKIILSATHTPKANSNLNKTALTSIYSAHISMLPTNSQTWLTFHALISSLCEWHLMRCWLEDCDALHELWLRDGSRGCGPPLLVGDPRLRFGLGDSNFSRLLIGVELRSSGDATVACCCVCCWCGWSGWLEAWGSLWLFDGLLAGGCCGFRLIDENDWVGYRVFRWFVDGLWLRLFSETLSMFGRFVDGLFRMCCSSASFAARACVQ